MKNQIENTITHDTVFIRDTNEFLKTIRDFVKVNPDNFISSYNEPKLLRTGIEIMIGDNDIYRWTTSIINIVNSLNEKEKEIFHKYFEACVDKSEAEEKYHNMICGKNNV